MGSTDIIRPGSLRARGAFTLIELLVVILIVAILIAVALPSFLGQTQKAQDSAAQQQLAVAYEDAKAVWTSAGQQGFPATLGSDDTTANGSLLYQLHAAEPELQFVPGPGATLPGPGTIEVWYPASPTTSTVAMCEVSASQTSFCITTQEAGTLTFADATSTDTSAATFADYTPSDAATSGTMDVSNTTGTAVYIAASSLPGAECVAAAVTNSNTPVASACPSATYQVSATGFPSLSSAGSSTTTTTSSGTAPQATSAPTISPSAPVTGAMETVSSSFSGTPTPTVSYQWYDCPSSVTNPTTGQCTIITGATASTYTPQISDRNLYLSAVATAANGTIPNAVAYSTPTQVTSVIAYAGLAGSYTTGSGTSNVGTYSIPVTTAIPAGDLAVISFRAGAGGAPSSISDSSGNTWTVDASAGSPYANASIAHSLLKTAIPPGSVINVTMNTASYPESAQVNAFSGVGSTYDVGAAGVNTSGSAIDTTLTPATTSANELAVTAYALGGGLSSQPTFTIPGGAPWVGTPSTGNWYFVDSAYRILSATTNLQPGWNGSGTTSPNASTVVVTYK